MNILHLTDFHVTPPGQQDQSGDVNSAWRQTLARVAGPWPAGAAPDLLVITGDIADAGDAGAYQLVADELARLGLPYVVVPGNHDRREPFRAVFRNGAGPAGAHVACASTFNGPGGALRILALDTLVEGAAHGGLFDDQLAWLERELQIGGDAPALLLLHHPPFMTGAPALDEIRLRDGAPRLEKLIRTNGNVAGVLCGHVHRVIHGAFAGVACITAPSPAWNFELDFNASRRLRAIRPSSVLLMHRFDGKSLASFTLEHATLT